MQFSHMTDFAAHDITLNDAAQAHFKISGTGIDLRKLTFNAKLPSDNTDGLLLCDVENAYVSDCHIQNSDDCLKVADRAHNVTFEHSSCTGGHGLTIGGGGSTLDVKDATWRDIDCLGM